MLIFSSHYKKHPFGFSIIELIVSASIIAIISVMVVANFRGSNQKVILDNEAERLASVIRQAHINALIGQTVGGVRPPAFGIHFIQCHKEGGMCIPPAQCGGTCTYNYFVDFNDDGAYDEATELVQTITTFDKDIEVLELYAPGSVLSFNVLFSSPDGVITFTDEDGNEIDQDSAEVYLHFYPYASDYSFKSIYIYRDTGKIQTQ